MKRLIMSLLICLTAVLFQYRLSGMPAYPNPVVVTQNDGSRVTVRIYGDEFYNRITTIDGYTVLQKEDGLLYYAVQGKDGLLAASDMRVNDPANRKADERAMTASLSKGLMSANAAALAENKRLAANRSRMERLEMRQQRTNAAMLQAEEVEHAKAVVLLVEFQDVEFTTVSNPKAAVHDLFNLEGYSVSGSVGSVRDYFLSNSNGRYDISFDVVGPYKVSREVAYYGQNGFLGDINPGAMVKEACQLAYADGVDFSQYAVNGEVQNLIIIYAGYGEADSGIPNTIWQHEATLSNLTGSALVLGGTTIDTYACSQEIYHYTGELTGIGVVCHEYSHVLGVPDFYDTDGPINGTAMGLWVTSVMDAGGYLANGCVPPALNAVERFLCGWLEFSDITQGGRYSLEPLYGDNAYRLKTYVSNEFFVFEFRDGTLNKWDKFLSEGDVPLNLSSNVSGLMVYHYDKSTNRVGPYTAKELWSLNRANAYASHQCVRMVTSILSTEQGFNRRNMNHLFFPGENNRTELTPESTPGLLSWANKNTGFSVKDIAVNNTQDITFTVINLNAGLDGFVSATPRQFGITLSVDGLLEGEWLVACNEKSGGKEVFHGTFNSNIFNVDGLKPGTLYEITVSNTQDETNFAKLSVQTTEVDANKIPSLNIASAYSLDEPVILDVINLQGEILSVKWYVNGTETPLTVINPGEGAHEIKCVVTASEDTTETFIKIVNIK